MDRVKKTNIQTYASGTEPQIAFILVSPEYSPLPSTQEQSWEKDTNAM